MPVTSQDTTAVIDSWRSADSADSPAGNLFPLGEPSVDLTLGVTYDTCWPTCEPTYVPSV